MNYWLKGTKNPENGNDTVIKVAIKVERAAKVLRSLTSVKSPVTEEIVVHRRLNSSKNVLSVNFKFDILFAVSKILENAL